MIGVRTRCEQVPELLFQLEHGELSPAQAESLEQHLRGCERCRERQAEFDRARATVRALRGKPSVQGGPSFGGKSAPAAGVGQRLFGIALLIVAVSAAAWGITRTVTPGRVGSMIENLRGGMSASPPDTGVGGNAPGNAAAGGVASTAPQKVVRSERIPWSEEELGRARAALQAGAYDRRLDPMDGAERDLEWMLPDGRSALGTVRIVYLGKQSAVVEFPRKDGRGLLRFTLQPLVEQGGRELWFTVLLEEIAT